MKGVWILIVIGGLAGAGIVFGGPYWTLYEIQEGYKNRDAGRISQKIDFSAVQVQLTKELKAHLVREATEEIADGDGATALGMGLGALLANAFIEPMIRGWVSPQGVQKLIELIADSDWDSSGVRETSLFDIKVHWNSLSEASVEIAGNEDGKPIGIILEREGWTWRITGLSPEIFMEEMENME